jgi:hypothetical protein
MPSSTQAALAQAEDAIAILTEQGLCTMELSKAYHFASDFALECQKWEKAVSYAFAEYTIEHNLLGDEVDYLKELGVASVQWIKQVQQRMNGAPGRKKLSDGFWRKVQGYRSLWMNIHQVESMHEDEAHKKATKLAKKLVTEATAKPTIPPQGTHGSKKSFASKKMKRHTKIVAARESRSAIGESAGVSAQ